MKIAQEDKFLSSSHESWASGDPNALTTGITEYKAGRDLKGPIPVASEIDFAPASNPHIPLQQMTRLVGIGSSAFASNQFIEMLGNRDLAVSLINELAGDEMLIASRERLNKNETAAFYISDQEARHMLVFGSVVEPAILFLIAITVHGAQEVFRVSVRPAIFYTIAFFILLPIYFWIQPSIKPAGALEQKQESLLKLSDGIDAITVVERIRVAAFSEGPRTASSTTWSRRRENSCRTT